MIIIILLYIYIIYIFSIYFTVIIVQGASLYL